MAVKMTIIIGILTFMSMTKFHECFKIDIVAYAINMSQLKNLLQIFNKHSNYVTA